MYLLIVYVSVCHVIVWRTEDNLWESIFSFNRVGPRVGTEAVSLVAREFTCLTHLAGSKWGILHHCALNIQLKRVGWMGS